MGAFMCCTAGRHSRSSTQSFLPAQFVGVIANRDGRVETEVGQPTGDPRADVVISNRHLFGWWRGLWRGLHERVPGGLGFHHRVGADADRVALQLTAAQAELVRLRRYADDLRAACAPER